jgi:nondiscriminating aspartyl-tRNA synthetase
VRPIVVPRRCADAGDERWLGEWAAAAHDQRSSSVTGYPMIKRPFYTYPDPEDPSVSNSFDLLFRGLELVTGGQRLHRYDVAALEGDELEPFRWLPRSMHSATACHPTAVRH